MFKKKKLKEHTDASVHVFINVLPKKSTGSPKWFIRCLNNVKSKSEQGSGNSPQRQRKVGPKPLWVCCCFTRLLLQKFAQKYTVFATEKNEKEHTQSSNCYQNISLYFLKLKKHGH